MSGLHEAHLIPGLVQDLQSLRLKLDTSVKRSEMLTEQYMHKLEKPQQQRPKKTAEFACQTELQVNMLDTYFILNADKGSNDCLVSRRNYCITVISDVQRRRNIEVEAREPRTVTHHAIARLSIIAQ